MSRGFLGRIIRRGREERLAQFAGSLAFTTALSMVPLLAVSFALFMRVPALRALGEGMREHLLRALLPPDIARIVLKYLAQFTSNASALTLMGFVALLASAFALVMSVENALNRIWQAKKQRPLLRRLVLFTAVLLAAPMAIGASVWATSMVATRPSWVPHSVVLGPVFLAAVSFSCLFRFVPHAAVPWRSAIAGGLLAGIAFEFGKRGFALYLAHVPTYRTVYRSFAPLVAFLLWVYYSWWVTLAAALVSAGLSSRGNGSAGRRQARA